jgi:hypothetical protein
LTLQSHFGFDSLTQQWVSLAGEESKTPSGLLLFSGTFLPLTKHYTRLGGQKNRACLPAQAIPFGLGSAGTKFLKASI